MTWAPPVRNGNGNGNGLDGRPALTSLKDIGGSGASRGEPTPARSPLL